MSQGDDRSSKRTKSELLIEEALRSVERAESAEEIEAREETRRTSGIARIDLAQFVKREDYLKLAADFENFKRRALKERQENERLGREHILRGFLDILDNLERGLAQTNDDRSPLAQGMQMILSQAHAWMKSEGLERIKTLQATFDPAIHEAVGAIESENHGPGMIVEEVRSGYRWSDRILRPAGVIVAKGTNT